MIEYYKGDYKYVLARVVVYDTEIKNDGFTLPMCQIAPGRLLTIKKGYAWDGPSGPTIDTPSFMRGSLIHDALYQLLRETEFGTDNNRHEIRRHRSDQILRDVCTADGMWKWRVRWVYRGVRAGGGPSAAVKVRQVYVAP